MESLVCSGFWDSEGPKFANARLFWGFMKVDRYCNWRPSSFLVDKQIQDAQVTLRRNNYSRSKHKCTTVETLLVEKGRGLKVMRAVELYTVGVVFFACEISDWYSHICICFHFTYFNNEEQSIQWVLIYVQWRGAINTKIDHSSLSLVIITLNQCNVGIGTKIRQYRQNMALLISTTSVENILRQSYWQDYGRPHIWVGYLHSRNLYWSY